MPYEGGCVPYEGGCRSHLALLQINLVADEQLGRVLRRRVEVELLEPLPYEGGTGWRLRARVRVGRRVER
eukprot:6517770-Prymnesium_polylepis.2